jgi:hypothetical protein
LAKLKVASVQLKDIVFNSTAIAGMNLFMKTLLESNESTLESKIIAAFGTMAKGFTVPAFYTQISRDVESVFNIPDKQTKGKLFGPMLRDIPVARNQFYDKVNVLGETSLPNTDRFVSEAKNDKIVDLFVDKKYFPTPPNITRDKVIDDKTKEERLMTDKEFYDYSLERGRLLSAYIDNYYSILEKSDPATFEKIVGKFTSSATASAKANLKQENK